MSTPPHLAVAGPGRPLATFPFRRSPTIRVIHSLPLHCLSSSTVFSGVFLVGHWFELTPLEPLKLPLATGVFFSDKLGPLQPLETTTPTSSDQC